MNENLDSDYFKAKEVKCNSDTWLIPLPVLFHSTQQNPIQNAQSVDGEWNNELPHPTYPSLVLNVPLLSLKETTTNRNSSDRIGCKCLRFITLISTDIGLTGGRGANSSSFRLSHYLTCRRIIY